MLQIKKIVQIALILPSLLFASSIVSAAKIPSFESGSPATYCKEEWTKRGVLDQRMFDYCMSQEREGHQKLTTLVSKYSQQKWLTDALNYSLKEWTKRGVTQFRMVHHELKSITEGFEDIIYESKQPGWNKGRYQKCLEQWGIQFNMVVHCYKN